MNINWPVVYDRTYNSLKSIYLNSIEIQNGLPEEIGENYYYFSDHMSRLKEWCTIRMSGCRRMGHTYSLIRLIKEFNLRGVVVCPTMKNVEIIKRNFGVIDSVRFTSVLVLERGLMPAYNFEGPADFIAVDCAHFLTNKTRSRRKNEEIIYTFASHYLTRKPFVVIFVQ